MAKFTPEARASLCSFTYADGRRCRQPRTSTGEGYCYNHARKIREHRQLQELLDYIVEPLIHNTVSSTNLTFLLVRLYAAVAYGNVPPKPPMPFSASSKPCAAPCPTPSTSSATISIPAASAKRSANSTTSTPIFFGNTKTIRKIPLASLKTHPHPTAPPAPLKRLILPLRIHNATRNRLLPFPLPKPLLRIVPRTSPGKSSTFWFNPSKATTQSAKMCSRFPVPKRDRKNNHFVSLTYQP
jgi:hypothetical protein